MLENNEGIELHLTSMLSGRKRGKRGEERKGEESKRFKGGPLCILWKKRERKRKRRCKTRNKTD